ncbi:FAD assembly factor SdhE [Candidatus Nucleicultrix amoebiphila]|jgi:antitoxin CptB|uniref:FAD assembly factor SdhE n=1 Tax=Candidatus Nucleicultrix amoebiphila TaxID=1509244 RepID=UPI000A26CE83|nr:succinate dehydrogenase assembly factor 2 [Candidatus Nucleicultrix amoebiphila]
MNLKKLRYKAFYRSTREADFLFRSFFEKEVPNLSTIEIDALTKLLDSEDPEIFDWINDFSQPPSEFTHIIRKLQIFIKIRPPNS